MAGPIIINARAAVRAEIGGVERWAREMAARLPARRPSAYAVARPRRRLAHRAGHAWEQAALPALAARARASLVFSPATLAPLAWPRNAVVIHDLVALRHPEWYSPAYVAWTRAVIPTVARRARLLVTVSTFSRDEIAGELGLDPEAIAVVAGGVDERFAPGADARGSRDALGLPPRYALTVATPGSRKNLGSLGPAARRLRDEAGIELVAAGAGRAYVRGDGLPAGIRPLGYVPEPLLPGLYAGASAFVLPSQHEGFGLPVVEAMASGTPVVASDRAALPETCGGAALLVDPDDREALAGALVATAGPEAGRLRAAGLARAAGLTWARAAAEIDALLEAAAGAP